MNVDDFARCPGCHASYAAKALRPYKEIALCYRCWKRRDAIYRRWKAEHKGKEVRCTSSTRAAIGG